MDLDACSRETHPLLVGPAQHYGLTNVANTNTDSRVRSAGSVQLHSLGDSSSTSEPTPVEGSTMSNEEEDIPLKENGENQKESPAPGKRALGESQAGILELSTLITNPALKRVESSDILNLTLHQVLLEPVIQTCLLSRIFRHENISVLWMAYQEDTAPKI